MGCRTWTAQKVDSVHQTADSRLPRSIMISPNSSGLIPDCKKIQKLKEKRMYRKAGGLRDGRSGCNRWKTMPILSLRVKGRRLATMETAGRPQLAALTHGGGKNGPWIAAARKISPLFWGSFYDTKKMLCKGESASWSVALLRGAQ